MDSRDQCFGVSASRSAVEWVFPRSVYQQPLVM